MTPLVHVDFETFCKLNIKKVGADRYARHPSCELLLTAWAVGIEPVTQEERHPAGLLTFLERYPKAKIAAFNARFERLIFWHVLGLQLPISRFYCVMSHAYALGFFGTLRDVGEQLELPQDQQKIKGGTRLVNKFCSPRKPTKYNSATRWTPEMAPEDWELFLEYNRTDVTAERAIHDRLKRYPLTKTHWGEYSFDQMINDRGLPVDTVLVDACVKLHKEEQARLHRVMQQLTGLDNPNSQPQMLGWLHTNGMPELPNLQKATIAAALERAPDDLAHTVLQLQQQASKTSPAKWAAIQRAVNEDDRLRGTLQLWGASRTGRWAGRIFQPQNLPWPSVPLAGLPEILSTGSLELVTAFYEDVMEALVSGIRNAVTAPSGSLLCVADLKSIESVLLGYVSNCERLNAIFRTGGDAYIHFASYLFEQPENAITKEQRTYAKPPTLGCGYQLGARGLVDYAAGMGVEMSEEFAQRAVSLFREMYYEIPEMWHWLSNACMTIAENGRAGGELRGYSVRIFRDENFLFIELPSGRRLCYYQPAVTLNQWDRLAFSYMGKSQYTGRWERISTHGGKITENIVQAIARDILMHGMAQAETKGLYVVGHVHDEIIVESLAEQAEADLERLIKCMSAAPPWAPTLTLGAEGFITKRYRK